MGKAIPLAKVRRTQEERSASMRARLLDATVACLDQLGYARTTTPEIAKRAGVSRGAQLHHFPTKQELVTSAVQHLFERRHAEFLAAFAEIPEGADRRAAAIDLLWAMFRGPTFHAWLELAVAGRTDPELHHRMSDLAERLDALIVETFRELFTPPGHPNPFYDAAPRFVFALLNGLAVERIHLGDSAEVARVLEALKALAELVMPPDPERKGEKP